MMSHAQVVECVRKHQRGESLDSPFLMLEEVAAYTRAPLSSVRYWITTGRLESVRPGRRRMVTIRALLAFLESA